ncbi:MAG: hypothetical protein FJ288_10500 [Planctomycetes bacterium]|nr:hypothetical protein [Planctomycetota bacterium]
MLDAYDEYRRRMIAETSAFITWGLAHPDRVPRIPRRPVGDGAFSRAMQQSFWFAALGTLEIAPASVIRRFLRWAAT